MELYQLLDLTIEINIDELDFLYKDPTYELVDPLEERFKFIETLELLCKLYQHIINNLDAEINSRLKRCI